MLKKSLLMAALMLLPVLTFAGNTMTNNQKKAPNATTQAASPDQQFLVTNAGKPGVVTTKTGLQYKILTAGTGPKPTLQDTVKVDYEGQLVDGKVFDSSYKRGQPAIFPVANVIKGWQQALTEMRVGATWMVYIPASLAYGSQGAGGVIGPNKTLIFKVHLIAIQ